MDRAAAACNLSTSRFSVLFRRAMGVSYGQFSLRARLAQAAQRLAQGDATVEDVAGQLGFVDGSHLHRVFVKHFGATPAEYRRQFKRLAPGLGLTSSERRSWEGAMTTLQRPAPANFV